MAVKLMTESGNACGPGPGDNGYLLISPAITSPREKKSFVQLKRISIESEVYQEISRAAGGRINIWTSVMQA
jgi:hypothetical protein